MHAGNPRYAQRELGFVFSIPCLLATVHRSSICLDSLKSPLRSYGLRKLRASRFVSLIFQGRLRIVKKIEKPDDLVELGSAA